MFPGENILGSLSDRFSEVIFSLSGELAQALCASASANKTQFGVSRHEDVMTLKPLKQIQRTGTFPRTRPLERNHTSYNF
jgi:hypothetical protein